MSFKVNRSLLWGSPFNLACTDSFKAYAKQLIDNNTYLLKQANKTFYRQRKEFAELYNVNLTKAYFNELKNGKHYTCQFLYLQQFAIYWNIPLHILISVDLELQDSLKSVSIDRDDLKEF